MRLLGLVVLLLAGVASAAPDQSKRPVARAPAGASVATDSAAAQRIVTTASSQSVATSLRPNPRPRSVVKRAVTRRAERRKGQVCGDRDLQGDVVGTIPGRLRGCGIAEAVRLRSVSGITLSQPSLMDCKTAKTLKTWTDRSAKRALRRHGGGLAGFRVAAHYSCRTRNHRPGAPISEHGKGKAIDISGFILRDGTVLTVLDGWKTRKGGRALRAMHKAACGPFGTVLGPNSDRFHKDHFHFDTLDHGGGRSYCR